MALHALEPVASLATGFRKTFEIGNRLLLLVVGENGPASSDRRHLSPRRRPAGGGRRGRASAPVSSHRYMLDLETGGCAVRRREGWGPLKVYPVQTVDGMIGVDLQAAGRTSRV